MIFPLGLPLVLSLLCASVMGTAQGPVPSGAPAGIARQRTVGRLLDREGKPWVGAKVHLHACQTLDAPSGGWQDEVIVDSGARGRFSVKLIPGLVYSAYAVQVLGGKVRTTAIRYWVFAGQPIELMETRTNRRVSCRLEGQDAWKAQGPLRFEVRLEHRDLYVHEVERVQGKILLPPLPGNHAVLRILDARRRLISTRSIALEPGKQEPILPMLAPYQVRLQCRGGALETSPVLAGARVYLFNYRTYESLGKTDAQGRIDFWVQKHPKLPRAPAKRTILILAPGYSEALIPLFPAEPVQNARIQGRDERGMDLLYMARPQRSLRGVLLDANGKPLARKRLVLRSELFPVRERANLNEWVRLPREHLTDAQGRFDIPLPDALPKMRSSLVSLSLVQGAQETLLLMRDESAEDPDEELTLRLSELTSVTLHFENHEEGKPLLCHYLPLGPSGWRTIPQAFHRVARGRGRFELKLPPGRYVFAFETPERFLQQEITISAGKGEMDFPLHFAAPRRVEGRLQDADGKPVVGADLRWIPMVQRGRRKRWGYRSPLADTLAFNRVRTGAGGAFEFFLPMGEGEYQLSVTWRKTTDSIWHSPMLHRFRSGKTDILDLTLKLSTR